jgi:hypothetical protein
VAIEARRDENPDLRRDGRKAQAKSAKGADLDIGEKHLGQRGIDQMVIGLPRQCLVQGPRQEGEDRLREKEADHKADEEG